MNPIILLLTCANAAEATTISTALLERNLIACAKTAPVHALFQWKGAIDTADEVLLIMETTQDLCADIEKIVHQLHSYDTPVLVGVPIAYMSHKTEEWLRDSLVVKF
jgi:periplasmic divalent cation tolerance protein